MSFLKNLPYPNVIEQLSYDEILKAVKELFKKHISKDVKIKAAGGIRTLEDMEEFINLGCERIGSSSIGKLC